jgi:hypothetical protein
MTAIACPECGKTVSSRAPICRFCGYETGEATDEDRAIFQARRLRDRIYRLNMTSYFVIALLLGGFGWFWWESAHFSRMSSYGPLVLMGIAASAYLVVRVLLFRARSERRALRRGAGAGSVLRRRL